MKTLEITNYQLLCFTYSFPDKTERSSPSEKPKEEP